MRRSPIARILVAATMVSGLLTGVNLAGQDRGNMPRGGELRRFSSSLQFPLGLAPVRPGPMVAPAYPGYPYYQGYFGTPWFIPQTRMYKELAPQYEFPKLGLQYLYPYAHQFGIQVPPETDEPVYAPLPEAAASVYLSPRVQEGISLLRKGRYADAGRAFARDLRDENAAPDLYLLIAEALVGAGKPEDAEIVLRHAIDIAPNLDFLDRAGLAGNFPSGAALGEKIAAFPPHLFLLRGTFLILAGEREKGLEDLRILIQGEKGDPAAKKVYLHFLGAAFGGEEKPAAKPEKKAEAAPPPPPEKAPPK